MRRALRQFIEQSVQPRSGEGSLLGRSDVGGDAGRLRGFGDAGEGGSADAGSPAPQSSGDIEWRRRAVAAEGDSMLLRLPLAAIHGGTLRTAADYQVMIDKMDQTGIDQDRILFGSDGNPG